jgi:hypothetical protein
VNAGHAGLGMEPKALGLLQLRSDLQFARIEPERRNVLVEAALADGRFLAADVRLKLGSDPGFIAASCGVPVLDSEDEAGFGSILVFAEYSTRPPTITLYDSTIRQLDARIAAKEAAAQLGVSATRPLFLAHELYHHFDCTRREPLSRRHRVDIFRLGGLAWTSGLSSLAEIAAGAFAQELLGLPFHPKLLDQFIFSS